MRTIETLTEKSWQIPYSTRVDSISNFQYTYAEVDDLIVEDLVSDAHNLSAADINKIREVALNEPLLKQRLVSPSGHVTSISAMITLPNIDQTKEVPEVMSFARKLADEIRVLDSSVEVRLSGMVPMNNAFAESASGKRVVRRRPGTFVSMARLPRGHPRLRLRPIPRSSVGTPRSGPLPRCRSCGG